MGTIYLQRRETKLYKRGEVWVYASGIDHCEPPKIEDGEECSVFTFDHEFMGKGYYNSHSKIAVRLLTHEDEALDEAFLEKRIKDAIDYRNSVYPYEGRRLINSEADQLSGLTVDQYKDYLCVQITSLGLDVRKETIFNILDKLMKPLGIYEKDDMSIRTKEGLKPVTKVVKGEIPSEVIFDEDGILMSSDIKNGQKTGYYLDQRANRELIGSIAKGKSLLDICSNSGGFSLHALKQGASKVTCIDISKHALEMVKNNCERNAFACPELVCSDALVYLKSNNDRYDIVVLDPPPFVKVKEAIEVAYKGYYDWAKAALSHVNKKGYFYMASCSEAMAPEMFKECLKEACGSMGLYPQFITETYQPLDHPVLFNGGAGLYLKSILLRII